MQSLIILTWPYPILVIGDKNYLIEKKKKNELTGMTLKKAKVN